jgi:hypothetical protein
MSQQLIHRASRGLVLSIALLALSSCALIGASAADNASASADISATKQQAIKVEIVKTASGYQLLRGGKPYTVRGAGINSFDLPSVLAHGGNSVRTWAVDDGPIPAQLLLDRAHALGMTVSLCLEFARERQGFDYNDSAAVALQLEQTRARVLKYKDHPALLSWIIGNELNFDFTEPKVFDAVQAVSKMIHQVDGNHPTTTALAHFDERSLAFIAERATDLDFISFQIYADLINLPKHIARTQFELPYFVTEWGAVGHWEVAKTSWGAPIENTSTEKAANYQKSYQQVLQPYADQAIGNYVFLWGQKQEKTPTWYGVYLSSGEETETVDVLEHFWTGQWPDNRSPTVKSMTLAGKHATDNITLQAGQSYPAVFNAADPESDILSYRWEVRIESSSTDIGGDHEETPQVISGLIENGQTATVTLRTALKRGAYRLFVYAFDDHNHAAHANIPFYVQ